MRRTVHEKHLVPPVVSSLMEKLYKSGALKFHCAILHCTGYDHSTFTAATRMLENPQKLIPMPGAKTPTSNHGERYNSPAFKDFHPRQHLQAKKGVEITLEVPR